MSGIITGRGTSAQWGQETTWGTAVAPTVALNYLSETMKLVLNKKAEDTLNSQITTAAMEIMNQHVEGDITLLLKPENAGYLLACLFGVETGPTLKSGTTGVYEHEFTCIAPGSSNSLKKFTLVIDRHTHVKGYAGCKVDSFSMSASPEDHLKATFGIVGKSEATDTTESLSVTTLKGFRFVGGSVKYNGSTSLNAYVKSVKLDIKNNLTKDPGISGYLLEPEPQDREITFSIEARFDTAIDTIREAQFIGNATVDFTLEFVSPELIETGEYYTIKIVINDANVTDLSPNVSGADQLTATIEGKAMDNSGEPITVTLYDGKETDYVA